MGLNGGQLGYLLDPNGEKCVTVPRQVSALHHKDIALSLVAASDGATVCVTTRGDIYLLADYQCKKMASKQLNLKKVLVSGGHMEYKVDPEHLKENGGQKICILAMDGAGRVFCWRSVSSSLKQCRWAYPRQVFISDIALSRNEILFVTRDGEGFRGKWFEEKRKSSEKKAEILSNLHNASPDVSCVSDINSVYERIRLEKLTFAHRAVSVSTDPSGCNFAVLQSDPKTSEKQKSKSRSSKKVKNVGEDDPASSCAALEMPIHSDILKVILDYLYTDEAVVVKESQNVDFVCSVLVVADQLLITRLKEICEVALSEKLTLKNAAMLLEFAAMYNAEQLKLSCLQFIGLNMAALLEARESMFKKTKTKAKKKPRKRSDSSGGYNLSDIIQSPPSTELLTSDSEGSYAGVGSPRDLQSPDFTTGFHSDKIEMPCNVISEFWASSPHSVSSKSFRDFIVEEKKSVTGHSSGDHVKKVCFKGIENSQAPKVVRCSTHGTPGPEGNHISDVPLVDSPNPWLSSSLTAPSVVAPVTFASIVEEELQQEAALIRSREKPLALIQIEERAIQDLLVFYEAFGNPDEFVVVERTPQGPLAVPMWNKHGC
ncbi:hypothetical protein CB1_000212019 [Camelus ferus]|nr:hypothetical protein CB1_000212019 [Camelus ferus]